MPSARQSANGKSVLASTDETGTRNKSGPLHPMTLAGRTLRLVKSVNGIGRRTTSFREQFIENVVVGLVPGLQQIIFRQFQPLLTLRVGLNGHAHAGVFGQRQALLQMQFAVLIDGIDRRCHVKNLRDFYTQMQGFPNRRETQIRRFFQP